MVTSGNTVTLRGVFQDAAGAPVDPDGDVTLRIYNAEGARIREIVIPLLDKVATGTYEYDWAPPIGMYEFSYEFTALVDGKPETGRRVVPVTWS